MPQDSRRDAKKFVQLIVRICNHNNPDDLKTAIAALHSDIVVNSILTPTQAQKDREFIGSVFNLVDYFRTTKARLRGSSYERAD